MKRKIEKYINQLRNEQRIIKICDSIYSENKNGFDKFVIKFKSHIQKNKEAREILIKFLSKKELTEQEINIIKTQSFDILKSVGIGIPTILLPFGILFLYFIVHISKKLNIDILPSYLKDDNIK